MKPVDDSGILVELDAVRVAYGGGEAGPERILTDLSADIRSGDAIAVLGPSGAGKTTLLKVIAGRQPVSAGRVRYHFDAERPGQFGYVSQSNSLLPWLSVYDNVGFPLTRAQAPPRDLRRDGAAGRLGPQPRL